MIRKTLIAVLLLASLLSVTAGAQTSAPAAASSADLRFVVYLTRHGVRSPTSKSDQYNKYSSAPWPVWPVPPGYLTPHGFELMRLFGAYDRTLFAKDGLFKRSGCDDARSVTFYADSDQRTQESGKALAAGLFPDCGLQVHSLTEGTADLLFHPTAAGVDPVDAALAYSAISGRIGGSPQNLTEAYRPQIVALDKILATCGASGSAQSRSSLLEIPAVLSSGKGDHAAELKGPINTSATFSENILLEYTEGLPAKDVAWGCIDGTSLRSLINLHTAASDFAQRTPAIGRMQASNLLDRIQRAMQQAATGKPDSAAIARATDHALFLVGHDTNLLNIAGLLNLSWIADGRRDDTAPGSAFVFELWQDRVSHAYFVRTWLMVQTLEQMRESTPLTLENPPVRIPLFLPGCSEKDFSCPLESFSRTLANAIVSRSVRH